MIVLRGILNRQTKGSVMKLQIGRKYVYLGKIVTLKDLEDGRAMVFSWHGGHRWVDIDKLEDNLP